MLLPSSSYKSPFEKRWTILDLSGAIDRGNLTGDERNRLA